MTRRRPNTLTDAEIYDRLLRMAKSGDDNSIRQAMHLIDTLYPDKEEQEGVIWGIWEGLEESAQAANEREKKALNDFQWEETGREAEELEEAEDEFMVAGRAVYAWEEEMKWVGIEADWDLPERHDYTNWRRRYDF